MAHQAYYSLIGRDYEWELMPLALDQSVGAVVWSPLGWGRLTGKIRRGQPLPAIEPAAEPVCRWTWARRCRTSISISVVDALDAVGGRDRQDRAAGRAQLAAAAADRVDASSSARATRSSCGRTSAPSGWKLTAEQVARLDAASATTLAYPYWHQRGFADRNPPPV